MPHELNDHFKDECGVFGIFMNKAENDTDAARTAFTVYMPCSTVARKVPA